MKYTYLIFIGFLLSTLVSCTEAKFARNVAVVPRPLELVSRDGSFLFSDKTVFVVENEEQAAVVNNFIDLFTHSANFKPQLAINSSVQGDIHFETDTLLKSESYSLNVSSKKIDIKASDIKGFFYALQSIRQLLPASIEREEKTGDEIEWSIPALYIQDEPRFEYRSLLLDVSRYFIPKENVLRIIDCMSMLKMNTLHLHLTDDNGWRVEIKRYPRLTEVGAWRVDRGDIPFPARKNPLIDEPKPIGGFYTQEDIKEMVKYAAQRQVEIVPEIDIPAHSCAALAAYPKLACPVVKDYIGVLPGLGGKNAEIIFCAGNDEVFSFLKHVMDEVLELFPSRYIHIGGDEAAKTNWEKCSLCQERMKKENLANEEDLQGYFMKQISDYVRSKNREVIGWDELTNSSFLPEESIILGWQGYGQAALKAAEKNHRFIMTPARVMYLIRYQGPQWFEPLTYFGNNTLEDVYNYEPIQENWKPEYASLLMGVQGSLWTEFCNNPEDVDYLLFPRLAAVAEVGWTQPEGKNWAMFLKALDNYNEHLTEKGIVYARSMYNIQHKVTSDKGVLKVSLECIRPDVEIRYTVDESEPTANSLLYVNSFVVSDATTIKSATFSENKQRGQTLVLPIAWNKATAKPILESAPAGMGVLTNGLRGSLKHTDFEWCSWPKNDVISFTIDLEQIEELNRLTVGCITNYGMAVHKPKTISISVSDNNEVYRDVASLHFTSEEIFLEGTRIEDLLIDMQGVQARYLRVRAEGPGACPADHVRPGQESKIYFDEIIIE